MPDARSSNSSPATLALTPRFRKAASRQRSGHRRRARRPHLTPRAAHAVCDKPEQARRSQFATRSSPQPNPTHCSSQTLPDRRRAQRDRQQDADGGVTPATFADRLALALDELDNHYTNTVADLPAALIPRGPRARSGSPRSPGRCDPRRDHQPRPPLVCARTRQRRIRRHPLDREHRNRRHSDLAAALDDGRPRPLPRRAHEQARLVPPAARSFTTRPVVRDAKPFHAYRHTITATDGREDAYPDRHRRR